jgi:hypothetical protein
MLLYRNLPFCTGRVQTRIYLSRMVWSGGQLPVALPLFGDSTFLPLFRVVRSEERGQGTPQYSGSPGEKVPGLGIVRAESRPAAQGRTPPARAGETVPAPAPAPAPAVSGPGPSVGSIHLQPAPSRVRTPSVGKCVPESASSMAARRPSPWRARHKGCVAARSARHIRGPRRPAGPPRGPSPACPPPPPSPAHSRRERESPLRSIGALHRLSPIGPHHGTPTQRGS